MTKLQADHEAQMQEEAKRRAEEEQRFAAEKARFAQEQEEDRRRLQ
jgi:hypothetical protein